MQVFSKLPRFLKKWYSTFMADITICPKRFSLKTENSQNDLLENDVEMQELKRLLHRSRLHLHNDNSLDRNIKKYNLSENYSNDSRSHSMIDELICDNIALRSKIKKVRIVEENLDRKYNQIDSCITAMESNGYRTKKDKA